MMTLIAAVLAAAAPATPSHPAPAPANAHAQHGDMAMKDGKCCCEEMMKKHDGHEMRGMQDHQDHQDHGTAK